jgi:nucleoside-diphosphate-sugar epimerase
LAARGHEVVALVRSTGTAPAGIPTVVADLADEDSLRAAVQDATPECVVHLAAEIATQRDPAKIKQVNVDGTRRLINACEATGVRRIVFTSTVVTGEAHGAVLSENDPLPVDTEYGRSKMEGERMLHESSVDCVIVRPGHVYGPGGWYRNELIAHLKQPGRFAIVGSGDNMWDVVHVADVASALADAAEFATAGETFHCADDHPITQFDFVSLTAEALGLRSARRAPHWLVRLMTGADTALSITRSARTSNAKLKQELGWQPRFPDAQSGIVDVFSHGPNPS